MEKEIRKAIKREMLEQELNQSTLAEKVGISRSAISQLMTGRRGRIGVTLIKILDALGLEIRVGRKENK